MYLTSSTTRVHLYLKSSSTCTLSQQVHVPRIEQEYMYLELYSSTCTFSPQVQKPSVVQECVYLKSTMLCRLLSKGSTCTIGPLVPYEVRGNMYLKLYKSACTLSPRAPVAFVDKRQACGPQIKQEYMFCNSKSTCALSPLVPAP